jgi:hypothetical protein
LLYRFALAFAPSVSLISVLFVKFGKYSPCNLCTSSNCDRVSHLDLALFNRFLAFVYKSSNHASGLSQPNQFTNFCNADSASGTLCNVDDLDNAVLVASKFLDAKLSTLLSIESLLHTKFFFIAHSPTSPTLSVHSALAIVLISFGLANQFNSNQLAVFLNHLLATLPNAPSHTFNQAHTPISHGVDALLSAIALYLIVSVAHCIHNFTHALINDGILLAALATHGILDAIFSNHVGAAVCTISPTSLDHWKAILFWSTQALFNI